MCLGIPICTHHRVCLFSFLLKVQSVLPYYTTLSRSLQCSHSLIDTLISNCPFFLFFQSSCVSPFELTDVKGRRGWGRSQIIQLRESLALHKSFLTVFSGVPGHFSTCIVRIMQIYTVLELANAFLLLFFLISNTPSSPTAIR